MSTTDGGPAFPTTGTRWENDDTGRSGGEFPSVGMSLRDYFAASAITGILARPGCHNARIAAEEAGEIADAMIAARGCA